MKQCVNVNLQITNAAFITYNDSRCTYVVWNLLDTKLIQCGEYI
jgi:hypothetical protein